MLSNQGLKKENIATSASYIWRYRYIGDYMSHRAKWRVWGKTHNAILNTVSITRHLTQTGKAVK